MNIGVFVTVPGRQPNLIGGADELTDVLVPTVAEQMRHLLSFRNDLVPYRIIVEFKAKEDADESRSID